MKLPIACAFLLPLGAFAKGGSRPITMTNVFVQSGEVSSSDAVVMARCNGEQDAAVTVVYGPNNGEQHTVEGKTALACDDFTVSIKLEDLKSNTKYHYRVLCDAFSGDFSHRSTNASFQTAPDEGKEKDVSFVWAADLAGQGWGRNPDLKIKTVNGKNIRGGYVIFEVMEAMNPDFAVFQGDMIYADNAIPPTKEIPEEVGGGTWVNNPPKDFVAITLDEFRDNWKYNFGDEKMQSFLAKTPIYCQWDDHEVTNNWYPTEILGNPLYPEGTAADSLYCNSLQAFYEYNPIMESEPLYRSQRYSKHLEVFFLDLRSYRDPNPDNYDPDGIAMMGKEQLEWLKQALLESTATWKVISTHDPVGIVTGGEDDRDSWGQNEPEILGRELELKDLFSTIYEKNIERVVFITSDVHFTAAVSFDPERAGGDLKKFMPFYEFVIGPVHAGAFGPGDLDPSFGPEYEYVRGPGTEGLPANLPPPNLQSFGHAMVSKDGDLTIKLIDITGEVLYEKTLEGRQELPITETDVFIQSGEVTHSSAIIMARCNSEEASTVTLFYRVGHDGEYEEMSSRTNRNKDYTISMKIDGLKSNTKYTYYVRCEGDEAANSAIGRFKTSPMPDKEARVSFVWVADLAGQGWGRNPDLKIETIDGDTIEGGYVIFEVMEGMHPDFAIFQGDMIYADNAIPPTKVTPEDVGGIVWINNPSKDFVAITLDEFRDNWKYNFGDEKMQRFLRKTPVFSTWDDHEVTNNWWPGEILGPPLYPEGTEVDDLAVHSLQAFYEYNPLMDNELIYRSHMFGKHLEVFFVDLRSYRDPNPENSDPNGIKMMGKEQTDWLIRALKRSTATWKVLSTHDPISIVTGGPGDRDSWGQDECRILGREFELKEVFTAISENDIKNVVSITTDVHYTAAIPLNPEFAVFKDFDPFYEFVVGPIHAGAFGPGSLDGSFGPEYEFVRAPGTEGLSANLPPPYLQSFGHASVSPNGKLTVKLVDITGEVLYEKTLTPAPMGGRRVRG